MPRVADSAFDQEKEEIAQDIENTLDRVVNDYSQHWKGVIGEWIQNSYDGWCHNRFGRITLPDDHKLHIAFEVSLDDRKFRAGDNAGGMPADTFHHNFAGLDTPGEEKQTGDFGGAYGRGSHVIAGVGEEMYAETHHDGWRGGLFIRGGHQMQSDPELGISHEGTVIEVYDCDVETLIKLTEWDRVKRYIQSRFHPLLQHDNVTVEYTIDGETHVVEPLDLSDFEVLWEGDLSFEYRDDEYTLQDVRIYDRTSADVDIPVDGVSMLKSNEHMDRPFMRVQEYRPRQLRHLSKMFGFCDASDLCPEFEDNAHNSFTGNIVSETPLKQVLEQLERQHFIGTPTDLDAKDEIVDTTLEVVNNQWSENPFDDGDEDDTGTDDNDLPEDENETEDEEERTADEQEETQPDVDANDEDALNDPDADDDEDDDLDELDLDWADDEDDEDESDADDDTDDEEADDDDEDETPEPEISCSTRSRSFNSDDDIDIWVFVENPAESGSEDFTVTAELQHEDTGKFVGLNEKAISVPPGEGSTGEHSWTVSPDDTGKYFFRAYLHDESGDDSEEIDHTHTWFWVGRNAQQTEQEAETVAFLEDVFLVRKEDEDFRAELSDGDRGMILVANTRHPEYKHSVREDGRNGTENQTLTLIRWAHEAIMHRLLLGELDDRLADVYTDSGDAMNEELGEFVRGQMIEQMSELMAGAHEEV